MPVGKRKLSQSPIAVKARERARLLGEAGLCRCGQKQDGLDKSRCGECRESDRAFLKRQRQQVIQHYGGKCVCCGETEFVFLAMDHIEGNGNQHRLAVSGHKNALRMSWFIRNNFPSEFQILCHNCNMAKSICGICPHQKDRGN